MREEFIGTTEALLTEDPRTALVLADISADGFRAAQRRYPDRVINVGIREQLMVGVAGGLALTGLRPIVHSYATFTVDRVYEQLKLDLDHQETGAIVVSVGASYDGAGYGRTHFSPGDVALFDTLNGWTVHVPGHPDEVPPLLRAAARHDDRVYIRLSTQSNASPHRDGERLTEGRAATVIAVGPLLDAVLAATEGLDVTVIYTNTPRPLAVDPPTTDVAIVEPYLAGTSTPVLERRLAPVPHRILGLGVGHADLHRFGTPADHDRWHGLDPAGLRQSLGAWLS